MEADLVNTERGYMNLNKGEVFELPEKGLVILSDHSGIRMLERTFSIPYRITRYVCPSNCSVATRIIRVDD
ncbi:MAG: hypothetical protein D5R96_07600 [Methanocalculus sp. MSAO_Arc2]|nr:MAG: hypothetical protein D5R96_07600 [Methanocalculus sp. MSAO_Arc2]